MTTKATSGVLNAPPIFTKEFISTQEPVVTGGSITFPHGLGVAPKLLRAHLVCISANLSYSIGDTYDIETTNSYDSGVASGRIGISPDATNINLIFGSSNPTFSILDKSSHTRGNIVNSRWEIVISAWA